MHPDLEEALRLLTKHAGMAQAEKSFSHLIKKPGAEGEGHVHANLESVIPGTTEHESSPTAGAKADEDAKNVMLAHDANHPDMAVESDWGDSPAGETSDEESTEGEHDSHSLGIMSTNERAATKPVPMAHGIHETAKRRRGRPRKMRE